MVKQRQKILGFTLMELLVVITIFSIVLITSTLLYSRYTSADRRLKLENELYEETRFTLERIVKEFREGTIDYEEYWNMVANKPNPNTTTCSLYINGNTTYVENYGNKYGNCYGMYAKQFYDNNKVNTGQNPNNATNTTEQDNRNAVSTNGTNNYLQTELYIIDSTGTKKKLLRLQNNTLQFLQLNGYDLGYGNGATKTATANDGKIDTWVCAKDFTCGTGVNLGISNGTETGKKLANKNDGWVDYSPPTIQITDLKFYIAPLEDPRKAFNENSATIQMQPHVTIILTAELSDDKFNGVPGEKPKLTLQTTVSARAFNEVK